MKARSSSASARTRLVEGAVRGEPLEPFEVKGRRAKVAAWWLLELSLGEDLSNSTPFVGRKRELDELRDAFARTRGEKSCQLCTIAGAASIGKSRLAEEFLTEIGDSATIAVGRCLSYGEAITYPALLETVRELVGQRPIDALPS